MHYMNVNEAGKEGKAKGRERILVYLFQKNLNRTKCGMHFVAAPIIFSVISCPCWKTDTCVLSPYL